MLRSVLSASKWLVWIFSTGWILMRNDTFGTEGRVAPHQDKRKLSAFTALNKALLIGTQRIDEIAFSILKALQKEMKGTWLIMFSVSKKFFYLQNQWLVKILVHQSGYQLVSSYLFCNTQPQSGQISKGKLTDQNICIFSFNYLSLCFLSGCCGNWRTEE